MINIVVGFIELIYTLFLAVITAWLAFTVFSKLTRDLDEIEEVKKNNIAVSVTLGSIIISVGLVVKKAAFPAVATLQTVIDRGVSFFGIIQILGISLISALISIAVSLAGIWLAVKVFTGLTRNVDELTEIRKNNMAVAIIIGAIILLLGMFISQGIENIFGSIIPMPSFEKIRIN